MPENEKVEILTEDYLDFYRQHPPAWVAADDHSSTSKLEKWLLLEKAGKRAYHDHEGNVRPHPVAVKNHEEWFNQNFGGQENVPEKEPAEILIEPEKLDPEVEKLKQLDTDNLRDALAQIKRLLSGQQIQLDNSRHRIQQLQAARSIVLIAYEKDPNGEHRKELGESISKEIAFYDKQEQIVQGLIDQVRMHEKEWRIREKKSEKKVAHVPKAKFQYDSPEESAIGTSPLKSLSEQGGGVNSSYIITLENGKKAIFKPAKGESDSGRKDIPRGTYFKREVAAYQMAKIMGFEKYVPVTVIRKEDKHGIGSAQEFIEGPYEDPFSGWINRVDSEHIYNCAFFDAVIGNEDRHMKNILVRSSDKMPILIDHGLAFPNANTPSWPRSVFIKYLHGNKAISPPIVERHRAQLNSLIEKESEIRKKLAPLLEPLAIDGIFWRMRNMLVTNDYSIRFSWRN